MGKVMSGQGNAGRNQPSQKVPISSGMRSWKGSTVHGSQMEGGHGPHVNSVGEREGIPEPTPEPDSFFGRGGSKNKVAEGLTTGERLRSGGMRPSGKVKF